MESLQVKSLKNLYNLLSDEDKLTFIRTIENTKTDIGSTLFNDKYYTDLYNVIKFTMSEQDFDICACGGFHYIGKSNYNAIRCDLCKNLFCNYMNEISENASIKVKESHDTIAEKCNIYDCKECNSEFCTTCKDKSMKYCDNCDSYWCVKHYNYKCECNYN